MKKAGTLAKVDTAIRIPIHDMWQYYDVEIQLIDRIVGGCPKNPETTAALLKARGLEDLIPVPPDVGTMTEEEKVSAAEAAINKSWVGFREDENGPYLEARCFKACLKESANILKVPAFLDVRNLKSKLAERVFVQPMKLHFHKPISGTGTRPIHAMTAQGPRTSLKMFDYIEQPKLSFRLKVLDDGLITEAMLRTLLGYATENGLGSDRGQEEGKFTLLRLEKVTDYQSLPTLPVEDNWTSIEARHALHK